MAGNRYEKAAFARALERVDVPARVRQTGLVLAHHMNAAGVTWIGHRRLADHWAVGRKRLNDDVRALEKVGVLEVSLRSGPHGTNRYRSLAHFVGESADIVLENGTVLPARSSGDALDNAARSSGDALDNAARSSGDALTSDQPPARSFEPPARSFEPPARCSGDANHQTTPPPLGGGVVAAAATSAIATVATPWGVDVVLELAARRLPDIDVDNERLRHVVAERLSQGWEPESLVNAALSDALPKKLISASGLLRQRLERLSGPPRTVGRPPSTRLTYAWHSMLEAAIGYHDGRPSLEGSSADAQRAADLYWEGDYDFDEWRQHSLLRPPKDQLICLSDLEVFAGHVRQACLSKLESEPDIPILYPDIWNAVELGSWDALVRIVTQLSDIDSVGPADKARLTMQLGRYIGTLELPPGGAEVEPEPACEICGSRWRCPH